MKKFLPLLLIFYLAIAFDALGQGSIAKKWNEELLHSIRNSRARPTVHARNLYHWSILAHDCWAVYEKSASSHFLGKTLKGYHCKFNGVPSPEDPLKAKRKALSFASYRLLKHRYKVSPNYPRILSDLNAFMQNLGYDVSITSTNYKSGNPAHLGNYIAENLIKYGHQDGANEKNDYSNHHYTPLNDTLNLSTTGTPGLDKPNHWQPLQITKRVDQAGNPIKSTQTALSPEWGDVDPFALPDSTKTQKTRQKTGKDYYLWLDPGPPPYIDTSSPGCLNEEYKWNFLTVSIWQSHLDPADTTQWDVSPGNVGNVPDSEYPDKFENYDQYYNFYEGGGPGVGRGYDSNPITGKPYPEQKVKRADYARILAEYWADGISSETPPGHWYAIYNQIENDSLFLKQWNGKGDTLGNLEYDVKAYLTLGGAMHDAAIAAWSVKGWYDYVRPVSAIRWMASNGQCSDPNKMNFDSAGIPLVPGYVELVKQGDSLAGPNNENVGEIKLYTWRGHDYIQDPEHDTAGVGWILAGNWWPYQKPSFVTPPFPGYVSGHSTFSRAASRIMTEITGSPYFPSGMSNFHMGKNEFLEHENGPTEDVYLQYASYKDASDFTSLSRIWGGIHPPADDINGRKMGKKVGNYAFDFADSLFKIQPPYVTNVAVSDSMIGRSEIGGKLKLTISYNGKMDTTIKPAFNYPKDEPLSNALNVKNSEWISENSFEVIYEIDSSHKRLTNNYLEVDSALGFSGLKQKPFAFQNPFQINTLRPVIVGTSVSDSLINDSLKGSNFFIEAIFNEPIDTTLKPEIRLTSNQTLQLNNDNSRWLNSKSYEFAFQVDDQDEVAKAVGIDTIKGVKDLAGNKLSSFDTSNLFAIDMKNPQLLNITTNTNEISRDYIEDSLFITKIGFSKPMDTTNFPRLNFHENSKLAELLEVDLKNTYWLSDTSCKIIYDVNDEKVEHYNFKFAFYEFTGLNGNPVQTNADSLYLNIDTERPEVKEIKPNNDTIATPHIGIGGFEVLVTFSEPMEKGQKPVLSLGSSQPQNIANYNIFQSNWVDSNQFLGKFDVTDSSIVRSKLDLRVNFAEDRLGNSQIPYENENTFNIDLTKPEVFLFTADNYALTSNDEYLKTFTVFNKEMDTTINPELTFKHDNTQLDFLRNDSNSSRWINSNLYQGVYKIKGFEEQQRNGIDVVLTEAIDLAGNQMDTFFKQSVFDYKTSTEQFHKSTNEGLIKVYPNPLNIETKKLIIDSREKISKSRIQISDTKGEVLFHKKNRPLKKGTNEIDLSFISGKGVFVFKIFYDNKLEKEKLILR